MLSTAGPVFHELGEEECRRLMPTAAIGRLGFTENALPSIAPVHFRVIGDTVVLASLTGSKVASADRGDIVAFEVDAYEPATAEGWTVSVLGPSSRVTDPDEVDELDRLDFAPWTGNPAQCYIRIRIERIRGRRLCRETPDAAAGTQSG
jgi:uncharacterized protein